MSGVRYPDFQTADLAQAYAAGASLNRLSGQTGMNVEAVRQRLVRAGVPMRKQGGIAGPRATPEEVFARYVTQGAGDACWEWQGPKTKSGACVNPAHLEVVTSAENKRRRRFELRTHCFKGHPLTPDNLLIEAGARRCRICRLAQRSRQRQRKSQGEE